MPHEFDCAGTLVSPVYLKLGLASWNRKYQMDHGWIIALKSAVGRNSRGASVDFLNSPARITPDWADSNIDEINHRLEDNLHHAFRMAGYAQLRHIGITGYNDYVELHGRVPTYFLKQLAQSIAASYPGVQHVINNIEVVCPR